MWRWLLFVGLRIFWALGPAVGMGCAVGGPRAVRTASFDRCVGSLSGTLQTWLTNLACNSPASISSSEFTTLKSQCF